MLGYTYLRVTNHKCRPISKKRYTGQTCLLTLKRVIICYDRTRKKKLSVQLPFLSHVFKTDTAPVITLWFLILTQWKLPWFYHTNILWNYRNRLNTAVHLLKQLSRSLSKRKKKYKQEDTVMCKNGSNLCSNMYNMSVVVLNYVNKLQPKYICHNTKERYYQLSCQIVESPKPPAGLSLWPTDAKKGWRDSFPKRPKGFPSNI